MLDCASLGDAVQCALGMPRGGAANLLLAHAEGEILNLELTARDADFSYGDARWLVHANHFESPRLRCGDLALATSRSTLVRAARARRLLSAAATRGTIGLDDYRTILADHAHGAYAICRHPVPSEPPLQQTTTCASLVMNLSAQTLYLTSGQPCTAEYAEYTIAV
jgi:isopenicillin-N N-acyltransferase-like protein